MVKARVDASEDLVCVDITKLNLTFGQFLAHKTYASYRNSFDLRVLICALGDHIFDEIIPPLPLEFVEKYDTDNLRRVPLYHCRIVHKKRYEKILELLLVVVIEGVPE